MLKDKLKKNAAMGFTQARALLYTAESLPLPLLNRLLAGEPDRLPTAAEQSMIIEKARKLLSDDSQDLVDLKLPLSILKTETTLLQHASRWLQIVGDSAGSFIRRRQNITTEFSENVKNLDQFPDYYQRNFHHQTDGYLSDASAHYYEHQVELLFRGLADPMRRRLLKPMVNRFRGQKNIKILEIGCGTGAFTRFLNQALPDAQVTAIDLSPNYIKKAKSRTVDKGAVDFMVADAQSLPFKDGQYDAVVSVFLHHELPKQVREEVMIESHRVLKPDGFWGFLDSIQLGDDTDLDFAIVEFPKTFHEPFFTNYIKSPILDFVSQQWPERLYSQEVHLLSKVVYSQ